MIRTDTELNLFKENLSLGSLAYLLNLYISFTKPENYDIQGQLLIYAEIEARIKAGGRKNG